MNMQMEHALSSMCTDVRYQPVAGALDLHLSRDMCGNAKQSACQRILFFLQMGDVSNVLFRDDQHVYRRLRIDVLESVNLFILVHAD